MKFNEQILFNLDKNTNYTLKNVLDFLNSLNYDLTNLSKQEREGKVFDKGIKDLIDQFTKDFGIPNSRGNLTNSILIQLIEANKIIRAQRQLKILNYFKDEPNGILDDETKIALIRFKVDNKFSKINGKLDKQTIDLLNEKINILNFLEEYTPVKINYKELVTPEYVDQDGTLTVTK